jgi:polysaccharide pyruvyl transferase WcaK-like protein
VLSRLATGSIGTQAFIISSMHIIKKQIPQVEFIMLSCYPEMDRAYYCNLGFDVNLIKRSENQLGTIKDILSIIKNVDAVVSVWGDGYISNPPYKLAHKTAFLKYKNKPTVLFPSSIGPFSGKIKTFIAKKGLKQFDKIMVRDTVTFKYFKEIGLENVTLLPDTAFILEPSGESAVDEIFKKENIPTGRQYIGLNISQLLNCLFREKKGGNYPLLMAEIADHLYQEFHCNVLLIPHQVYLTQYEYLDPALLTSIDGDDRYAIREVMKYVKNTKNVYPVLGEYNAMETKGVIGRCQIFIGGRMHSIIGALSLGIPSVILQYSHKAQGVMDMLELAQYVWDHNSSKEELIELIDTVWNNRNDLKRDIQTRMTSIKKEAWRAGEILLEELKKQGIKSK